MANKRLFIYAAFLAICYLLGATWAETATQTLTSSSSNSNNNASQLNAPGKAAVTTAAPAIATPKVISSTATSANTSSSPSECSCVGALLPQVDANGKELPMCAECKCSHVARNTTLIKDEPTPPIPAGPNNQELSARANVLNRVGHQQDKWKRQVREQRRHIYDRHTMLN
ncbi:uncharacterized protein CG1161 isoform X2 [Drosophila virilis]|uniref:uncharacterized protein CG1161 isoform X2 n=1 Tax=Drosophila virilis TaxID=7244 RepID=UPI00139632C0|nr:uncharacterized protein CG1161 isoform X2 [Drosophila virilis]